jgi:hypothetical protein
LLPGRSVGKKAPSVALGVGSSGGCALRIEDDKVLLIVRRVHVLL